MKLAEASILIVPGWGNSGEDHWQSRWEAKLSSASRVMQEDWLRPVLHRWTRRIIDAVIEAPKPVILVGHSAGVPTIIHAAPALPPGKVRGAYLVSTPSEAGLMEALGDVIDPTYCPFPREKLPFPAVLVASRNDDYCDFDSAQALASAWGANLVDAGHSGHINAASGHGPWPEGLMGFGGFINKL